MQPADQQLPSVFSSPVPTLAELIIRGDIASARFHAIVDDFCQERQTLLYHVATVKKGVRLVHAEIRSRDNSDFRRDRE
jgi:hypothetical protein